MPYTTKQQQAVLRCLELRREESLSAADLAEDLRQMGDALGRFIYLMDAVMDYHRDARKNAYNPLLAMGTGENRQRWEEYLLLTMGRCTRFYEKLPLVQDKALLDNILYSGVWVQYRGNHREGTKNDG